MNLTNKYAVVTGASTGIGRATAISLAKAGATVVLVARTENKLKETQQLIESAGGHTTQNHSLHGVVGQLTTFTSWVI